jgi:hypothetical protein
MGIISRKSAYKSKGFLKNMLPVCMTKVKKYIEGKKNRPSKTVQRTYFIKMLNP